MTAILKIHAASLEGVALQQIYKLKEHPAVDGLIAIMPDAHAGAGCVIGTTLKFEEFIVPSIVGVDIGCGLIGYRLGIMDVNYACLDREIKENIPVGMKSRGSNDGGSIISKYGFKQVIQDATIVQNTLNIRRNPVENQIGTLGGGNHFIEIGEDAEGVKWLFIHSGSRNFGLQVAMYYQKLAEASTPTGTVPKGMEYLRLGDHGSQYLRDMRFAQRFAWANREAMLRIVLDILGVKFDEARMITSVHNYISFVDGICRKGAISACKDEKVIVPLNMRDGTIIGVGKGNPDYNYSAPHGAGRAFSRSDMKQKMRNGEYTVETFKESMTGIFTTTANGSTIDEAPLAYKPFDTIKSYLEETVEIKSIVKPVYNLKAAGD